MKRTAKWMKKLTLKELQHIADTSATGKPTITALKNNREFQKLNDVQCYECRHIALKLGIETSTN